MIPVALRTFCVVSLTAVAACTSQAELDAGVDSRLREMAGKSEAGLLAGMGRIPDNTYQLQDGSRVLQWRWDTSYIDPGSPPIYTRMGGRFGGWLMPMGGFPPMLVRQECIVEWTLANGAAQAFRWQGEGCSKVAS